MASGGLPSEDVVLRMSLAEFARQSFVLAGLKDSEILGLGEAMEFDEEEFATVVPSVILAITGEEFEEALGIWEAEGRRAGMRLKGRARFGREIMQHAVSMARGSGSGSAEAVRDQMAVEDEEKKNDKEEDQGQDEFQDAEASTTAGFEEIDGEPYYDVDEDDRTGGTVTPAPPATEADDTLGVFKRVRNIGTPMLDKLGEVVAKLAKVTADTTRDTHESLRALADAIGGGVSKGRKIKAHSVIDPNDEG